MVARAITFDSNAAGWLRGLQFDLMFIAGIALAALACGWMIVGNPKLFLPFFMLNGWLLGYHHVVSTYTRLTFDSASFREHRFLVMWLPLIVLAGVVTACLALGIWVLTSAYLYWQWWHYTRQSYGVSRIYSRKAGLPLKDRATTLLIYAVPLWGILYRSYQAPAKYLFADVKVFPVPFWLVVAAGVFSIILAAHWISQQVKAWFEGRLALAHSLYICSHLTIFSIGYVVISDINHGWLVLNVWHNCQYILTVWMFNNNRFKAGVDERHRFLSFISQRRNIALYLLVCLGISTLFYSALSQTLSWAALASGTLSSLPLFAIVYQAINFHHYLVDAVIWKVRKKKLRENLGLAA
jgi:hypothetical protein